jgi:glycosyltransferase involved in cell wall biosynthesis
MNKLRVAIIGVYPPPYGGVSVHVQRLLARCLEGDIRCVVFDHGRHAKKVENVYNLGRVRSWLRFLFSGQDIVHVHTSSINWIIAAVFFCLAKIKGAKYVLSYHSLRESEKDFGVIGRRMMRFILKSAAYCIAINSDIKKKLATMGARPERISVIPAFLPPSVKEAEVAEIPRETWDFMAGHTPLVTANAFAIIKYQGQDLYGIDMCIDLCAALKKDYPRIGFVFCLPGAGDDAAFNELKSRVSLQEIEDNFLFQTKPCQYYPVLMKSDIFVRPTSSDSYGVSVAEALFFGVPAIASDVCPRPTGTVLFQSRNIDDFIARVKMVRENYADYKEKLESLNLPNIKGEILRIYYTTSGKKYETNI